MSTERRITTNEKPSAGTFPMTPAQHRQWAQNMRRISPHDLAKHHEQLARVIESRRQQQK